jgi:hypothetical protein
MRTILAAIALALLLPISSALAETSSTRKPSPSAHSGNQLPVRGAARGNPCALYGPGFVKVDGSDTCVKVGGGIDVWAGTSTRR